MDDVTFGVKLERTEDFAFAATFDDAGLPILTIDEPPPIGAGTGPNATRLVAAAVGHCLGASLLFCLGKARIDVGGVRAAISGTVIRNETGRMRIGSIDVDLTVNVAPDARERMTRCMEIFEDFCIVTQSIRNGIDVKVQVAPHFGEEAP